MDETSHVQHFAHNLFFFCVVLALFAEMVERALRLIVVLMCGFIRHRELAANKQK